jgi:3-oxoadipate enol-lactonase
MHVRAALDGPPESRLTPDEIKEVIMQAAIYCGVPAANHAFSVAGAILREKGLLSPEANNLPRLHWLREGQGPVVVLSHALGCDLSMWDGVAAILKQRFTVLRYDHRGHGQSAAPDGPYTMDMLADDAAALIQAEAGGGPVHFVGLSMGGMTAQSLAARYPQLVKSITIANAANYYNDAVRAMWHARMAIVEAQGVGAIAEGAIQRWFTPEFCADAAGGSAARVADLRQRLEKMAAAPYVASCAAVAGMDFRSSNAGIKCLALVIAGTRDEATPPALSEAIVSSLPGAKLATLPAAHLSAVEQPAAFAALLEEFIAGQL